VTVEGKALFETLAPPPGGVAVLRRRLQRERPRRRMRLASLGVGATLAIAGLLVAAQVRTARKQLPIPAEPHPALVRLGLQHPPREPAAIPRRMRHRMALQRVPLETDRVVFYYVAVLPAPSEPHR
jgi:hypothetical protein